MAGGAVLTELLPVLRLVVVVVAPETARKSDVADVAGIGAKRHVHVGKHVAAIDLLDGNDGTIDVGTAGRLRRRPIEIPKHTGNLPGGRTLGWVGRLPGFN